MRRYDVVIVGGGAAGLMCAIEAGKRGRRVLVIERSGQIGKKILISGGGRCNFTNLHVTPENFLSANRHFCKSALARYSPADFIAMVERHGIAYHEKECGQLFCDLSAKLIVTMLADECRQAGARIDVNGLVTSVEREGEGFRIETGGGPIHGQSLVVASGGLSIPKMGATNFGYELAKQFGHSVVPTRPALVPLTFSADDLAH
jgi:predicted Rossmann fold flavoprotein